MNQYTIDDALGCSKEIRKHPVLEDDILVSYDVTSLFTNVPVQETINILFEKAFTDNWFNSTYDLNLEKDQLTQLLRMASTDQLFLFDVKELLWGPPLVLCGELVYVPSRRKTI